MPYSITLRSKTDATITGWYDGSSGRLTTPGRSSSTTSTRRNRYVTNCAVCVRATVISIEPERRAHSQRDVTSSLNFGSEFARDSPQEGDDFELAAPPTRRSHNATIADSLVRLSTKAEPIPCIDGETYSP